MNKRGAEMVEYAIVLACIAVVGVYLMTGDEWVYDEEIGWISVSLKKYYSKVLVRYFSA